ncbi:MAG: sulfatase-like hydrolase/transferase [Brevibacterium yomogidense]
MCRSDQRGSTQEEIRRARHAYYAAVAYIDDHVGRIRQRLDELGLAENTVVVVTSDHGDMLGEKGLWYKMSPYEQSARVPLIVWGPEGLVPRGRFANPVSLLDLGATMMELAEAGPAGSSEAGDGLARGSARRGQAGDEATTAREVAVAEGRTGLSLFESMRRESAGTTGPDDRDVVIEYLAEGTLRPQVTLVRGRYKFVLCPGDPDQLFDLEADPDELTNRSADPEYAEVADRIRTELQGRYDLGALESDVLASQDRRRLVVEALQTGVSRPWDFAPEPQQRYVRGDFWGALEYGRIKDGSR